jgi:signal transduction histidine kinase
MRRPVGIRWVVLRTAWLLVGAAIGLAALLLAFSVAQVIDPSGGMSRIGVSALCLAPVLLIGLLPGVRELEVTAARTMLGVAGELVVPDRPRAEHRWRTTVLVTFHLVAGLLAAALLLGLVPGAGVLTVASLRGRFESLANIQVQPVAAPLALLLGLAAVLAALLVVWALGRLAGVVARRLLGPTDRDRLEVALARLEAESEHLRLARELHDGIGHALTIISVQAAGGRQILSRNPPQAGEALATIEGTARQALTELDGMLGLLRHEAASPSSTPDLDQLPSLLEAHRSAGMELSVELSAAAEVPRLVSTTAYRIIAEALTNAQRYAGPGPVRLTMLQRRGLLTVEARNPLPTGAPRPAAGSGLGLQGIGERVALFGGTVRAGAERTAWVLHAEIPTGVAGG